MRSILEKAITHLLNEENEKAEALFHKFMVERARQIHESLRQGEDELYDDVNTDEMFTEDDLSGLEDSSETMAGDDVAGDDFGGVDDAAGDDAGLDGDSSDDHDETAGDELGDDDAGEFGGEEGEGSTEDRISDLEAQLKDLEAQFHDLMGGEAAGDDMGGDLGGDDSMTSDEDTFGGEVDGSMDSAEGGDMASGMEDDMNDAPVTEGENPFAKKDEDKDSKDSDEDDKDTVEEDFSDISESVLSELEKVMVSMTDGKEIAAGKSFSQNNTSPALQKKPNPMADGKPVTIKASEHKGFERETAPGVKDMKKRKNTKSKAADGQSKISKEGDKSALINKTPGAEAQTHSPLAKR